MPSLLRLASIVLAACVLAALLAACGTNDTCAEVPLSAEAATALAELERGTDFPLARPCSFESGLEVASVSEDAIPEQGVRYPRVNFLVRRGGDHAFTLSQTRAGVPFRAIPIGSRWLRASANGLTAEGFSGPTGAGVDLAYLRWRRDGVTFELLATLGSKLNERDVQDIAEALMRAETGGGQ